MEKIGKSETFKWRAVFNLHLQRLRSPLVKAHLATFAYSSHAMQYPTWIRDIAINAIGLSGIRSECRGRRVRISPQDRLRRIYMLVLFDREKPLHHSRGSIARGTCTHKYRYTHSTRGYLILFTGLISRRTDIFFLTLTHYYEREWDLNKNAIFHVPRDYFPPILFSSTERFV